MKLDISNVHNFVHSYNGKVFVNLDNVIGKEKVNEVIVYATLLKEMYKKPNIDKNGFVYVDTLQKEIRVAAKLSDKTTRVTLQSLESKGYILVEKVACTEKCFGPSNRYYILKEETE